jgi:hypothetical protein
VSTNPDCLTGYLWMPRPSGLSDVTTAGRGFTREARWILQVRPRPASVPFLGAYETEGQCAKLTNSS